MGRMRKKFALELLIVGALVALMLVPACREGRPPLDRNKAPETFITKAPTETTATDYRVHMYWHGQDEDGVVTKYIYYISDTLVTLDPEQYPDAEALDWNPNERIADYLVGRFTMKTDTIITFKGYDDMKGASINRQAFHIAAVDDGGKIDPTPARLQFNARVKGVPIVSFWTNVTDVSNPNLFKAYNSNRLDTVSMFVPFSIQFLGTTVNNMITGYRWVYGGTVYPDYNADGIPDWLIPANASQKQVVEIANSGADVVPSGLFNIKVIARDEAGALSKSDIVSGEGVCRVVVNHDPNTQVLLSQCFFVPRSSGQLDSMAVDFTDAAPDTLPYGSLLRMSYVGWDDPKDKDHLQYEPPFPIRFQFQFSRWSYGDDGAVVAQKTTPWYPLKYPEDTNPKADLEPAGVRNQDSTTMRIGTFDYHFSVRSFDEQSQPDGTPPIVSFVGNFPPTIDSLQVGFYSPVTPFEWHDATRDTLHVGWMCRANAACGNKLPPFSIRLDPQTKMLTKSFRFIVRAGGHDDPRDPVDAGIKGWRYQVTDADPGQDVMYYKEGEWQFDKPLNYIEQECIVNITVPYKSVMDSILAQADSLVKHPPGYFGDQIVTITGMDIRDTEVSKEGIRGLTPKFDADGNVIPGDYWITNDYYFANYARRHTRTVTVYLKLTQ
jgi:hypothetical protein